LKIEDHNINLFEFTLNETKARPRTFIIIKDPKDWHSARKERKE